MTLTVGSDAQTAEGSAQGRLSKGGLLQKRQVSAMVVYTCSNSPAAPGLRYCALGNHTVEIAQCIDTNTGTERLTCQHCLWRQREAYAGAKAVPTGQAAAERDAQNQGDGINPDEDNGGVQAGPVDEFDAVFGDGSDLRVVDLPSDAAVSFNGAECIKNFDAALDAFNCEKCGSCREEGFDVKLKSPDLCTRCFNDKHEVRVWSDANNVNPSRFSSYS